MRVAKLIRLAMLPFMHQNNGDEELHENSVVDLDGPDLHYGVCGRQAELQKDRQELPDE